MHVLRSTSSVIALAVSSVICVAGCGGPTRVQVEPFGEADGQPVKLFTLTNRNGMVAKLTTYGAILTELHVPDRDGKLADVVLGFDELAPYVAGHPYFGATTGRVANRIAAGRFTLDGEDYQLATNNGPNHLHGGTKGLDKRVWQATGIDLPNAAAVKFTYISPHLEEAYPGTVTIHVLYSLTDDNELRIDYTATTEKRTPLNLTHHSYFNLAGEGSGTILGHRLMVAADEYLPVDATSIPTGEIAPVKDTTMDFTKPTEIGARIAQLPPTGENPGGYDHNYCLRHRDGKLALAARLYEPTSGRLMDVLTTEPGVQLYSGNYLDGTLVGKSGRKYEKHHGVCLEAQHWPDSINQPRFPPVVLAPGETYKQTTVHRFSTRPE